MAASVAFPRLDPRETFESLPLSKRDGESAPAGLASIPAGIQRQETAGTSASGLIDEYTSFIGTLDEEGLGRDLARRLPGQSNLANDVIDRLSGGDKDDVAYELSDVASDSLLSSIPDDLRLKLIKVMVESSWVTDDEEGEIARIWKSFGDRLPAVAAANRKLWKKSVDESDQLNDLPQIQEIRRSFKWDVMELARSYLRENRRAILLEGKRFGIDLGGAGEAEREPGYLEEIHAIAGHVVELQGKLKELRQIRVGYDKQYGPEGEYLGEEPATFNPNSKPDSPPRGNETPPMPTWDDTKKQHDRVSAIITGIANQFPSIYALIQQERLDEVAKAADSARAVATISETLRKTLAKIEEADEKVVTEDIAYYDLVMIYSQLFAGSIKTSDFKPAYKWDEPFYQELAKDVLADEEARQFWVGLGLSLVAAAALIAAPFTGGATLAFLVGFGVGIGAGQAAMSWERYEDLASVSEAHVRDELALIAEGQVSAALLSAILDTVGVFLDAYGAGSALKTAERTAARAAFEVAEKELKDRMAAEAKKRAVRGALIEGGITAAGAGLAVAQHELFGEEEPEIEAQAEVKDSDLRGEPTEGASMSIGRMFIQRNGGGAGGGGGGAGTTAVSGPPVVTGEDFEKYVERALKRGELRQLPDVDFVIPGQYTGSGWGIDRIGIKVDDATKRITVYHFEMKFQTMPELGRPGTGTQTGLSWTENAIEGLLTSSKPEARAAKERLRRAMQELYPGKYIDVNEMRAFLTRKLTRARVRIVVPDFADLRLLYRQVAALGRWGRRVKVIKVPVP